MSKHTIIRYGKDYQAQLAAFTSVADAFDWQVFQVGIVQPTYEAHRHKDTTDKRVMITLQMSKHVSRNHVWIFDSSAEYQVWKKTFHKLDPETGRRRA